MELVGNQSQFIFVVSMKIENRLFVFHCIKIIRNNSSINIIRFVLIKEINLIDNLQLI